MALLIRVVIVKQAACYANVELFSRSARSREEVRVGVMEAIGERLKDNRPLKGVRLVIEIETSLLS